MKLIKFEAKGFKSFAEKVALNFDGGIVGIVGPNGSGKSNINDAIRWALGERSIKALRGASAQEIIFSGSKSAPAANRAEVSLTFDNSDGSVSIPHKQFVLTRVIERGSGENAYYINNEVAKLKDIEEVAMESGISKSSLAIISQGTIQNIAQASPEDRRLIFEEAAGTSKYRARKQEAVRKLEHTSDALEQISTVTRELEKQLNPLKKQVDKAKIFLAKRAELKEVEIGLIVADLAFFGAKQAEFARDLSTLEDERALLNTKVTDLETDLQQKNAHKLALENDVHYLSEQYQEATDKLTNLEISTSQVSERRRLILEGQIKVTSEIKLLTMKEELEELNHKNHQYRIFEEKLRSDILAARQDIESWQGLLTNFNFTIEAHKREIMQLKTRIALLQESENNRSYLFKGTKTVLDNRQLFPGVAGIVADLLTIESKLSPAMEAVLGATLQNVVVDRGETAIKVINFLKANAGGRATFIPLDTIRPRAISSEHISVLASQPGFVGVASDLVSTRPEYDTLKKFLLGNVIVASTLEQTNSISTLLRSQYLGVALTGDLVRPGGVIVGGEQSAHSEILGLAEQIKTLEKQVPQVEHDLATNQNELSKLSSKISEKQLLVSEWYVELAKVKEKKTLVESQFNFLKSQYEAQTKQEFKTTEKTQTFESVAFLEAKKAALKADLNAKREAILNLNNELARLSGVKLELEKSLRLAQESLAKMQIDKNQADYVIKSSRARLSEEYEMTIEAASNTYKLKMDLDEARSFVGKIRQEIKELGHVNLDAIAAYEEINERFQKLKSSEEELQNAKEIIEVAIREMDQIIISRLDETVKQVNVEINKIFQRMFGGGHAEAVYTNPKDILETGIEVIAQPPGKTVKNLNLFSGGEKALVAISLLFAILKSRPLPLCILDEVEAALDEANVVRFANFLQELKHQTQFLIITHRVGTMARVDNLFGVTMQTKGVSSFLTVKLHEAQDLITPQS